MRPNFVYIFCDELKTKALSCYGGSVPTPNIDKLAAMGILYENCFCNSPVCVASRYSILTSRYPEETGVYHNEAAYPDYPILDGDDTFVNVLENDGYATASFGKTHIPKTRIPVFGYNDESGGEMSLGVSKEEIVNLYRPGGSFKTILAGEYPSEKAYQPHQVTEHGLAWVQQQTQPFFVRFSYLQPHTPIIVPKAYVDRLCIDALDEKMEMREEVSLFEKKFRSICDIMQMPPQDVQRMRMYYQALVLWIDDQVGEILRFFQEHDLMRKTVFIFHSDHGAGRGENGCLAKQIFAPHAQRVPLILSHPTLAKGKRSSNLCDGLDIAPTVLALAGSQVPETFQGVNLLQAQKEYVFATIGYGENNSFAFPNKAQGVWDDHHGWPRRSCIRSERYRFDMNTRCNGEPFGIEQDAFFCDYRLHPKEDVNMIDDPAYQEIIARLRDQLLRHIEHSVEVSDAGVLNNPHRK